MTPRKECTPTQKREIATFYIKNKELWTSGEASQTTYKAETGIADPRFTGLKFSAKTRLYTEQSEEFNQDFGTRSFGSLTELEKMDRLNLHFICNRIEQREQYSIDNKTVSSSQPDVEELQLWLYSGCSLRYKRFIHQTTRNGSKPFRRLFEIHRKRLRYLPQIQIRHQFLSQSI